MNRIVAGREHLEPSQRESGVEMKRANLSVAAARHALAAICSTLFLAAVQLAVFAGLAIVGLVSYRDLSAATGALKFHCSPARTRLCPRPNCEVIVSVLTAASS